MLIRRLSLLFIIINLTANKTIFLAAIRITPNKLTMASSPEETLLQFFYHTVSNNVSTATQSQLPNSQCSVQQSLTLLQNVFRVSGKKTHLNLKRDIYFVMNFISCRQITTFTLFVFHLGKLTLTSIS